MAAKTIHGVNYNILPCDMRSAPDNRIPCPVCGFVNHFYHTVWANQHGSERRYFCRCRAKFQVRKNGYEDLYCVSKSSEK